MLLADTMSLRADKTCKQYNFYEGSPHELPGLDEGSPHECGWAHVRGCIHFRHCNTIRNKSNMIVKCASLMQHASLVIGFGLCLCPRPCPALQLCLPRALPCLCPCKSLPLPSSWACPCRHCLHLLPQGRRTSNASQAACGLSEYREPILDRHP